MLNENGRRTYNLFNIPAVNAQIAFIAIFFASTWGPSAWVVMGESCPSHFHSIPIPIPLRISPISSWTTASNWLWNTIIAVIIPYMVNPNAGDLHSSVLFIWVRLVFSLSLILMG